MTSKQDLLNDIEFQKMFDERMAEVQTPIDYHRIETQDVVYLRKLVKIHNETIHADFELEFSEVGLYVTRMCRLLKTSPEWTSPWYSVAEMTSTLSALVIDFLVCCRKK
jgi:hypothetical protein